MLTIWKGWLLAVSPYIISIVLGVLSNRIDRAISTRQEILKSMLDEDIEESAHSLVQTLLQEPVMVLELYLSGLFAIATAYAGIATIAIILVITVVSIYNLNLLQLTIIGIIIVFFAIESFKRWQQMKKIQAETKRARIIATKKIQEIQTLAQQQETNQTTENARR